MEATINCIKLEKLILGEENFHLEFSSGELRIEVHLTIISIQELGSDLLVAPLTPPPLGADGLSREAIRDG